MSKQILAIGDTGAQLVSKFNTNSVELYYDLTYNVKIYGAVGDDNTVDTVAIQAAINAAHITGGIVYFPTGIYKTGTLTVYTNTVLCGNGWNNSVIKSNAAEPLISYQIAGNGWELGFQMRNLKLLGDSVGTIGLNMRHMAYFKIDNIYIQSFTTCGIKLLGSLIGSFNDCYIDTCVIGIDLEGTTVPLAFCNMVTLNSCLINGNSTWGIKAINASLLSINNCTIELNGTTDNLTTGSIYYLNADGYDTRYFVGLMISKSWFELNKGIGILLDDPQVSNSTHEIINSFIGYFTGTDKVGIKIIGTTKNNKLVLNNCVIDDGYGSVVMTGAKSILVNQGTQIRLSYTNTDGGTYTSIYDMDGKLPS